MVPPPLQGVCCSLTGCLHRQVPLCWQEILRAMPRAAVGSSMAADSSHFQTAPLPAGQAARKETASLGFGLAAPPAGQASATRVEQLIPLVPHGVLPSPPRSHRVLPGAGSVSGLRDAESKVKSECCPCWESSGSCPPTCVPSFQHVVLARLSAVKDVGSGSAGIGARQGAFWDAGAVQV